MAKKLLFFWLFGLSLLGFLPLCAYNNAENNVTSSSECTAPPPDSFRVTYKSTNEIALAWKSAWQGATQVLNVFVKNDLNEWDNVHSNLLVQGESHVVTNLISGRTYAFDIATRCYGTGGGHGDIVRTIDGTLIVELTLEGRTPSNPIAVDCAFIPKNAPWKGFLITGTSKEGYENSYFEVDNCDQTTFPLSRKCIKRTDIDNMIVATNEDKEWPKEIKEVIGTQSPFRVGLRDGNDPNTITIGWAYLSETPTHFSVCPYIDHPAEPWNTDYVLTALVADATFHGREAHSERDSKKPTAYYSYIRATNPFDDILSVFLDDIQDSTNVIECTIVNSNGTIFYHQEIHVEQEESFLIPTYQFARGMYFLTVKTKRTSQTIKIIKL